MIGFGHQITDPIILHGIGDIIQVIIHIGVHFQYLDTDIT